MALAPPGRSHAGRPTLPRNYLLTLLPSLHHRRKSGATGGESMVADPGLIHPLARQTTGFSATLVVGKTRHGRLLAAASSACQGAEGSCRSSHAEQSPPSAPLYPGANSFVAQQYCSHPRRWDRGFESRLLQQRVSNELFLAVFTIATTLTPAFGFRRKARPHRGHRDYIPLRR